MKWTGLNELREKYLSFFESKEHLRLPSFSLVPKNDKSLLLINSGMAPMKKYFTGEITPPRGRVTTCQKCIRTGDIENVGITDRHGTFFEMLGNFSFGDYFKEEAIPWAWEFCTEVMEMPKDRLWATIYLDDEESYKIWTEKVGLDPSRIVRLGKKDNFWEHGEGPCGPCTEIHFDRGPEHGCGKPDCKPGCDCDRYIEFWNVVFSQFDSDGKGTYTPLEHPNIDTGMGLERLACVMQDVDNLFLVDTVQSIMQKICAIAGIQYGDDKKQDISLRVITDHVRSCTFMIGDGVMPSNEGRGYVLRRLLRRAARHGRLLGIKGCFLGEVAKVVIDCNEQSYPELRDKQDMILKLINVEEESFAKTIDQGLQILGDMMDAADGDVLSGEDAFRLYDTFGFPLDLTKEILAERGMTADEETFRQLMLEQRERARNARKNAGADAWLGQADMVADMTATNFVGYTDLTCEATVQAIVQNDARVQSVEAGADAVLVLDTSCCYAESGGQVGDTATLTSAGATASVVDTKKNHQSVILHSVTVNEGTLSVGDTVTVAVDVDRRKAIMRNHTAAHLLQAALREVLGTHVEQAGQLVDDSRVRFDFTHFQALTADELKAVEAKVNGWILEAIGTDLREMPIDEARAMGAMALFGEKYGDIVRVVNVPQVSVELCGGTHVDNIGKVGLFHIVSESSVAAGVRRIEAVTGDNSLAYIAGLQALMAEAAAAMKANSVDDLARRAEQLMNELHAVKRERDAAESKLAAAKLNDLLGSAVEVGSLKLAVAVMDGSDSAAIRTMADNVKSTIPENTVVLLCGKTDTLSFACVCSADAVKAGAHAGKLIKAVTTLCGGNGGGRPDSAMGAGKDLSKLGDVADAAAAELKAML
ncbi:MAG: alanine--tRNA ligase [Clostridia bacterium]|nr:alanine--tRNA ligase [Clostridia bacterium]